jgi:hypothetical protein
MFFLILFISLAKSGCPRSEGVDHLARGGAQGGPADCLVCGCFCLLSSVRCGF